MDRARAILTLTSASMVLLFAASLLWLVSEHAYYLRQQTVMVEAQNIALETLGHFMHRLDDNYKKAGAERRELLSKQLEIIKRQEEILSRLPKIQTDKPDG